MKKLTILKPSRGARSFLLSFRAPRLAYMEIDAMKKMLVILALIAIATEAIATDFAYRLPAEVQSPGPEALQDLTWQQGTTPLISVEPLQRGRPIAASTNTTVRMIIGASATGTYYATATNVTAIGNAYRVQWPTIGTNTVIEGTNTAWWYTVYFEENGYRYWTGSGDLYIEETTSTDPDGLVWQSTISSSVAFENITGGPTTSTSLVAWASTLDASLMTNPPVAWTNQPDVTGYMSKTSNLADVADSATALSNLGGATLTGLTNEVASRIASDAALSNLVTISQGLADTNAAAISVLETGKLSVASNLSDVSDADAAWSNLNGVANGNLNWLRIDDIDVTLPGDLAVASNLVANKIYTVPVGDPPPEPWAAGTIGTAGAHFGCGYIDFFYALQISGLTSLVVNGVDGPTTRLGPGSVTFYNVTNEVYLGFGLSGNGEYIDTVGLLAADGSMLSNLTVEVTAYTATAPTGAVQAVGFFPVEAYTPTEATTFDFSEFSATKLYRNYEVRINQPGWITEWTYNGATLTPIVNPPASISTNVEVGAYGWWSIRSDYGEPTLMYIDGRTN